MKKIIVVFIHIFIILSIIGGCSMFKKTTSPKKMSQDKNETPGIAEKKLTPKEEIEVSTIFIEANKQKILGNLVAASDLFKECIKKDPLHAPSYFELAKINAAMELSDDAIKNLQKAIEINPDNIWYQIYLAKIYQNRSQYEKAGDVYEKISSNHPGDLEYMYDWAMIELLAHNYKEALKLYNRIEEKIGISEEISIQKEKIYLRLENVDKAVEEIQKLIDAFPDVPKYYRLLAELYEADNKPKKALEVYNKLKELDPGNPAVHLSLAKHYHQQGQAEKSFHEIKKAFKNENLDIDTKVKILLTYYITNQYEKYKEEAIELAKILIDTHPDDPKAHSVYADFLKREKRYNEAIAEFEKVIELDDSRYVVWEQLLILYSNVQDFQSMQEKSKQAMELFPQQPLPYFFHGMSNIQLKNYKQAIDALNSGKNLVLDDKKFKAQFFASMGDAFYELDNMEKAFEAYENSLLYNPDNAYVLNNYSYYLSLRDKNLEKAQIMAEKANELQPGSPAYLDTYGWVMFKLGKYEEAGKLISEAIKKGGDTDGTILEHMGDIQFKLGNNEQALEYWKKAKETGEHSETIDKKIKEKSL